MLKQHTAPTIRDIARRCGVTAATVSRVLNGNYSNNFAVSKEMQDHIIRTAEELGYRPNLVAKSLARHQTCVVGIIGESTAYGWPGDTYQKVVEAAIRYLQGHGYDAFRYASNPIHSKTELPPWHVDGILLIHDVSDGTIDELERRRLPYVAINGRSGPGGSRVISDDTGAAGLAIQHLAALGHHKIAYAGPGPEHHPHPVAEIRHSAYLTELSRHGLLPVEGHDKRLITAADFLTLAVLKGKATAILAYDHVIALQLLHEAPAHDIQIPHDVSLVCYNDEHYCRLVRPSLSTLGIPSRQMGRLAAQILLANIQRPPGECNPECAKLPLELTIRSSTGPRIFSRIHS